VWQTSWGVSTRLIGGLIMTHSDDDGLVLPPKLAPLQAVIVPFFRKDEAANARVRETGMRLANELEATGIRAKFDDMDGAPGPKFYRYEREGVCLRFGLGPRDLEQGNVEFKRRDELEKRSVPLDDVVAFAREQLDAMQSDLLERARTRLRERTVSVDRYDEFKEVMNEAESMFVFAHWDGTAETERRVKDDTNATIRCIPLDDSAWDPSPGECMVTQKPSARRVIWAKAY